MKNLLYLIFTNYNMDTIHIHIVVLAKLLGKSGVEDREQQIVSSILSKTMQSTPSKMDTFVTGTVLPC